MPSHSRHSSPLPALLALLLAACACTLPSTQAGFATPGLPELIASATAFAPAPATPAPTATPLPAQPSYRPVFESAPCAFPIPAGYTPQCGYLVVPQDRALPAGAQVRLHVAVFRSLIEGPAPDPVVHLAGGPGSSSLDVARYLFGQGLDAILEKRDFILFDQRGTGYSRPRLDCPERDAITPALLGGSLSGDQALQTILDAFRRCRDRLAAQGIDLRTYNSAASAADVNDLRLALGYDRLDLYGDSYGTRLALTVMRDYPQAVRSAVLDSTYPPEVNLYTALAPNAQRAFDALFDDCAADAACSAAYPDLRAVFYALLDQLNANPPTVSVSVNGAEVPVRLDGGRLADVLFGGLYNPAVAAGMPRMIYQIKQGEYALLRERLALYFDTSGSQGMTLSVQCAEEVPFATAQDAVDAARGLQPQLAAFFPDSVRYLFEVCKDWTGAAPNPRENQPVASDLPTLVLAGEFDPITPPAWGRAVAGRLGHAYFYEFRGNGHWVTRSSRCALAVALAFWDDPDRAPDLPCLQTQEGLRFLP